MMYRNDSKNFGIQRRELINYLKNSVGIKDRALLQAFEKIQRHSFVPRSLVNRAYDDDALPLGAGQTISKPSVIAKMIEVLKLNKDKIVLEIGTGSGYQAALLSVLCKHVYTLERIDSLTRDANKKFKEHSLTNISAKTFDGSYGWPDRSPFDAIILAAAAPAIPENLFSQMSKNGVMVCPVGNHSNQRLMVVKISGKGYIKADIGECKFVPLVGKHGWR